MTKQKTQKNNIKEDFKKRMKDMTEPQYWPNTPEGQMRRFEWAATSARTKKQSTFCLDGVVYDTKYVSEFIKAANPSEMLFNREIGYCYDILKQSAQAGKTGECFARKFSNAKECYEVMHSIQLARQMCGGAISAASGIGTPAYEQNKEMYEKLLDAAGPTFKDQTVEYNGKKYSILLNIPPDQQWKYSGVLNEEITRNVELETKGALRSACPDIDHLGRLYQLMNACGNPEIQRFDASPIKSIAGRSHFLPSMLGGNGTCYVEKPGHVIAELAHAFRNANNAHGEAMQFAGNGLNDILTFKNLGFTPSAQKANYKDKTKMEYDAHSIVEPALRNFMEGKIPTIEQMYAHIDMQRKKTGTEYEQTSAAKQATKQGYSEIKNVQGRRVAGLTK